MHGVIRALSLFDSEPLKVAELGSSDERFGKTTLKGRFFFIYGTTERSSNSSNQKQTHRRYGHSFDLKLKNEVFTYSRLKSCW